jgi:hypothetical protein
LCCRESVAGRCYRQNPPDKLPSSRSGGDERDPAAGDSFVAGERFNDAIGELVALSRVLPL